MKFEFDNNIPIYIQLVEQLQQKINDVPSNSNTELQLNDSQLLERLEGIEEKLSVLENV